MIKILFILILIFSRPQENCSPENYSILQEMVKSQKGSIKKLNESDFYGLPYNTLGLPEYQPFAKIYNDPFPYISCAKNYINIKSNSKRGKHFVVMALEKLPLEKNVEMLAFYYSAYKKGLIHKYTFYESFVFGFSDNKVFINHTDNKNLREIFHQIAIDNDNPIDIRRAANNILNVEPY